MKTSAEWWAEVKADPAKFNEWLQKQYIGELTAAERIQGLLTSFKIKDEDQDVFTRLISKIASDEMRHAYWIKGILDTRGVEVLPHDPSQRYWAATLEGIDSFETGTAVAAHAEEMRLERIKVIATDPETPDDIRSVFERIWRDEVFHAKAFRVMTTDAAYEATRERHELGLKALGLVI